MDKVVFNASVSGIRISNMGTFDDMQFVDRLTLNPYQYSDMASSIREMFDTNKLYKVTIEEIRHEDNAN